MRSWTRRPLRFRFASLGLAGLLLTASVAWSGQPVLMMHPTAVVFEGRSRAATVHLVNRGDGPGTFFISWVDYRMTPEGGLVALEGEVPWSIQPHVRFSPRRVTLGPGETQLIKIGLRRRPDVAEGEYYSHIAVRSLAVPSEADAAGAAMPPIGSSVTITARPGMAIPVVWRNSRARPVATIVSASLDRQDREVVVEVRREGELSVRGYLHLIPPRWGETEAELPADPVPLIIYPNLDSRTVVLPLGEAVEGLAEGTEVIYSTNPNPRDRRTLLASFRIPS